MACRTQITLYLGPAALQVPAWGGTELGDGRVGAGEVGWGSFLESLRGSESQGSLVVVVEESIQRGQDA